MRELKIVTLEELKMQMREDFCEEDEIINLYGSAAEDAVIASTRRSFEELLRLGFAESTGRMIGMDEEVPEGDWFPSRLKLAVLMLAAHSYRNREPVAAVAQNAVPYTVEFYLKPYRKLKE